MSKIIITFTVDREGDDFEGIKDLVELRNYIGSEVSATYFICPVYFTKGVSNSKKMRPVLEHAIKEIKSGRETPFFMNLGCHQEGSYIFKSPVADFFNSITEYEKSYIEFKTLK